MGQRRRGREYALQLLFQLDLTESEPAAEDFQQFWTGQKVGDDVRRFAEQLVRGVLTHAEPLDRVLAVSAEHWRIERMAVVDRNVLRIGVYEMLYHPDTPSAVVIDEAIEIAKKFGSGESGSFINGILDDVRRRRERGELDPPSPS